LRFAPEPFRCPAYHSLKTTDMTFRPISRVFTLSLLALAAQQSLAQTPPPAPERLETVIVTGSRIKTLDLTGTSPISRFGSEDIQLSRSVTVEDFSTKLPQLAGGVNSTSAGSDAFGAQTLDLRNLGQNRTLVLINGTRAVPFSFRNAVDVNFIPATLIKQVDVLTGGAAAVYGADAVAGVVNFILNDRFKGLRADLSTRRAEDGGHQNGASLTFGTAMGSARVVGFLEYAQRDALLAGSRSWALRNSVAVAGAGGNFRDVVSGRTFSADANGNFTTANPTTDYTGQYFLVQPMKRVNGTLLVNADVSDDTQAYGRLMVSKLNTEGAPRSGQAPAVVNAVYGINQNNNFFPAEAKALMTFVNGVAQVNVNRSLGELGVQKANNDRLTHQLQVGMRGALTSDIDWDAYIQFGKSSEDITVTGDGVRAGFASLVNTQDLFGPGANLSSIAQGWTYGTRTRRQDVAAATLSGSTDALFKLPAGAPQFAVGIEARREKGVLDYNQALGGSFKQSVETPPPVPPKMEADEIYAEFKVPLLKNFPGAKSLALEAAVRQSRYDRSVGIGGNHNTDKLALNWLVVPDLRVRASKQSVIREPNFGEFANPVFSIPFANLRTVARLNPRYLGDPCVIAGSGANLEQCARFKAPAVGSYDSLNPANLTGGYFFGGNVNIQPETGNTRTLGFVFTPSALPAFSATVDVYDIKLKDAVGQIQPVDALTSCYITDPSPNNPLCAAVSRDPVTGRIKDGFVDDRNLARISQRGLDIELRWRQRAPMGLVGHRLDLNFMASKVSSYTIQRNAVLAEIDCKGTFGSRCSSDSVSLVAPDYRHRLGATWTMPELTTGVQWKRIGKVRDSAVGSTDSIPAYDTFDLNVAYRPAAIKGFTLGLGVGNVAGKKPPAPVNASTFGTYTDTYDVLGRTLGLSLTWQQ
jgi:iron complex outermembrane recepter protein